ncbi:MAG: SIMPL domain-containing protein [Anaerolineales bacterium]|nr:SIMPL domain-containing protein [Anaerolineales bacterium]
MEQTTTILNLGLTLVLGILVTAPGLPTLAVQAVGAPTAAQTPTKTTSTEQVCDTSRSIQVSGAAVVNVIPDRVLIQLGSESNDKTPQKVETVNSATINRIIRSLKALGIEEKDIVTDYYIIQPVYESYDSLRIKGYRIDNVIAITLRDITLVNRVLVTSLEAGANEVINVEFYLSDLRKYRDQARELAMVAAQEKARNLALAAGAKTGCIMHINENTWSYYNGWWRQQDNARWTQNVVQNAAPAGGGDGALSEAGPVNLGQISVKAEVSATFSLK